MGSLKDNCLSFLDSLRTKLDSKIECSLTETEKLKDLLGDVRQSKSPLVKNKNLISSIQTVYGLETQLNNIRNLLQKEINQEKETIKNTKEQEENRSLSTRWMVISAALISVGTFIGLGYISYTFMCNFCPTETARANTDKDKDQQSKVSGDNHKPHAAVNPKLLDASKNEKTKMGSEPVPAAHEVASKTDKTEPENKQHRSTKKVKNKKFKARISVQWYNSSILLSVVFHIFSGFLFLAWLWITFRGFSFILKIEEVGSKSPKR